MSWHKWPDRERAAIDVETIASGMTLRLGHPEAVPC